MSVKMAVLAPMPEGQRENRDDGEERAPPEAAQGEAQVTR